MAARLEKLHSAVRISLLPLYKAAPAPSSFDKCVPVINRSPYVLMVPSFVIYYGDLSPSARFNIMITVFAFTKKIFYVQPPLTIE